MKYIISMFFLLSVTVLNAQTVDEAIEWNDDIVLTQSVMLSYEDDLIDAIVEDKSADTIAYAYFEYLSFINLAIEVYEDEPPFDSKDIFRKAILTLLYDFKEVAATQYAELIYIYMTPADELTDYDYERWDLLIEQVDDIEGKSNDAFLDAQQQFADQYGFTLGE